MSPRHWQVFAGLDVGASRSRCVVVGGDGSLLGHATGPGAAYHPSSCQHAASAIGATVRAAAEEAGCALPLAAMGAGVAGVGHPAHRQHLERLVGELRLAEAVVLTHDAEMALWGAFGEGAGIIVIAGTGAIAYGRSVEGREARAGGWGREMDDEGGAWWLGREVLRVVMRAHDGRGPGTSLVSKVLAATGCDSSPDLVQWIREPGRKPRDLAELALLAEEAAAEGDGVARGLVRAAGEALGELLAACQGSLGLPQEHQRAALAGGLARRAEGVKRHFAAAAERLAPGFRVGKPRLPAVFGALLKLAAASARPADEVVLRRLEEQTSLLPDEWGYE